MELNSLLEGETLFHNFSIFNRNHLIIINSCRATSISVFIIMITISSRTWWLPTIFIFLVIETRDARVKRSHMVPHWQLVIKLFEFFLDMCVVSAWSRTNFLFFRNRCQIISWHRRFEIVSYPIITLTANIWHTTDLEILLLVHKRWVLSWNVWLGYFIFINRV